jgi:pSer/pThr/pTyr-binding forkhead associated (FHA) protein
MSTHDDDEPTTRARQPAAPLRPRPPRAHLLELVKGAGAPARVELKGAEVVLGRGEKADILVDSEEVSRQHAHFVRLDEEYQVEDLESRNGVYLNGLKVHLALLREGDELQFGDLVYVYREGF